MVYVEYDSFKVVTSRCNLDLTQIVELAERGALGKLVEVESADGDIVEVVVE